jgi:Nucleoside 2-deoxyribosyltransferase like
MVHVINLWEGPMNKKVFLGGTCGDSKWREIIKPLLKIDYFDPVCSGEWTQEAYLRELQERENSDFVMYVITPKMTGVYSIAEVVDDSNKRPEKTLFCFLETDDDMAFNKVQMKSLGAVAKMVKKNGGRVFDTLTEMADFLNASSETEIQHEVAVASAE